MTYYRHYHIDNPKISHITIAARFVDDEFHYNVSLCSKKDQFSRKLGRQLAEQRLDTEPMKLDNADVLLFTTMFAEPIFKLDVLKSIIAVSSIDAFSTETLFASALYKLSKGH